MPYELLRARHVSMSRNVDLARGKHRSAVDLRQHRLKVDIRFLGTRGGADLLRRGALIFSQLP